MKDSDCGCPETRSQCLGSPFVPHGDCSESLNLTGTQGRYLAISLDLTTCPGCHLLVARDHTALAAMEGAASTQSRPIADRERCGHAGIKLVPIPRSSRDRDDSQCLRSRLGTPCSFRYWDGLRARDLRNARRIESGLPNPQSDDTVSMFSSGDSSIIPRAPRTRTFSTNRAGVTPVSLANTRAKFRGLIAHLAARASTVRFSAR
jgi:hypothetical protein